MKKKLFFTAVISVLAVGFVLSTISDATARRRCRSYSRSKLRSAIRWLNRAQSAYSLSLKKSRVRSARSQLSYVRCYTGGNRATARRYMNRAINVLNRYSRSRSWRRRKANSHIRTAKKYTRYALRYWR